MLTDQAVQRLANGCSPHFHSGVLPRILTERSWYVDFRHVAHFTVDAPNRTRIHRATAGLALLYLYLLVAEALIRFLESQQSERIGRLSLPLNYAGDHVRTA